MNCPGSIALSEGIPDSASFYSAEGTAAHELLEWGLAEEYHDLQDQVGGTWKHDGFEGTVSQEMVDAVQVAVDYIRGRIAEAGPNVEVHLERRVTLDRLTPPDGLDGGTVDITIWSGPELRDLEVADYKHGAGVYVEVEGNTQALYYTLGAIATDGRRPDTVRTTIIQPRHHAGDPVRSADYTWQELVEFKSDLFAAAEDTATPGAPLVVGDWCRFCPAHAQCPAHAEHAVQVAQVEFEDLTEQTAPSLLADPALMDPAALGEVLQGARFVEDWIKAVRARVLEMIDRGEDVPGWKLVRGTAHRKWGDEDAADQYMARKGLKKGQRYKSTLVSPAQAEKHLKAAGHRTTYVQRFIEKPEGAPKLVPAGDKRPALAASVDTDFADLTEE
jgi:hypothetical protein